MTIRQIPFIIALSMLAGCSSAPEKGVSASLASARKSNLSELTYILHFNIPEQRDSSICAQETITLQVARKDDIVLDFKADGSLIGSVRANGAEVCAKVENEHLIIPSKNVHKGQNAIEIAFTAGTQSLNRRDCLLYTLLVPDRARTLFPCFDQPDMKASYQLSLEVPESWSAISNTTVRDVRELEGGRREVVFSPTEPLSTYLFSFVAGVFNSVTEERGQRSVTMYHRETDPGKVAQASSIIGLVFDSLEYMEEYTGIKYPFAKYDFIVLPDFQYGGMEHTGATLYNDRRIFLGEHPTTEELLGRASLIAHETAHMWFGDFVTMKWFDDVWTKEVFANWFAAQMVRPLFPEINHVLGDLKSYYAAAYSEDRTVGSNAIQRPLDNLSNAGLIYCNIIYDKAPIMMEKLARRMGAEAFRHGVQDYLGNFAYSNATWDELIACLAPHAGFDVAEWSRVWVKEKGMPIYESSILGYRIDVTQSDPFEKGNVWQQDVTYALVGPQGQRKNVTMSFTDKAMESDELEYEIVAALPNIDGLAYGCFMLSQEDASYVMEHYSEFDDVARMSLLMTLYENVWRKRLSAAEFLAWSTETLKTEKEPLILGSMLGYAGSAALMDTTHSEALEDALMEIAKDKTRSHELRLLCFRQLYGCAKSEKNCKLLYEVWNGQKPFEGLHLGENDYTSMAYQLMIRFPGQDAAIRDAQRSRITNPDRVQTFDFVSRAALASLSERDSLFESLMDPANRRPESRVLTAMGLLNHQLRQQESLKYIRPALEELPEIQQTGDIFFPQSWCKALLGSHQDEETASEVRCYLSEHKELNPLLKTKVLQAAGYLLQ